MEMPTQFVHQTSLGMPPQEIWPEKTDLSTMEEADLDVLRCWFVDDMYAALLAKQPEHPLIRLNEILDFSPIVAQCQGFRSTKPQGAPEDYTIEQLCRALYVKTHFYESLRTAETRIRNDLIVRWFVGYSPYDDTLSFSTIQRFETWVRDNRPDSFLVEINPQIMLSLPEECDKPVIGDTFAVNADAASRLLPELPRHASVAPRLLPHYFGPNRAVEPKCPPRCGGRFGLG